MDDKDRREAYGQLLDLLAGEAMPGEDDLSDEHRMIRINVAMQLNQYAYRVRKGDVEPDDVTQVAMGLRRAVIVR